MRPLRANIHPGLTTKTSAFDPPELTAYCDDLMVLVLRELYRRCVGDPELREVRRMVVLARASLSAA